MQTRRADRIALGMLFAVYLVLLAWIVLFKLHLPFIGRDDMREIKLIPFLPYESYGASSPLEVLENAALFVPFGVYLRTLTSWRPWLVVLAIVGASLAFEVTQYGLALGSSDLTDVIVNTAGGVAGVGLYAVARRRFTTRTRTAITNAAAIGTLLALIVAGLIVALLPNSNIPHGTVVIM